MQKINITLTSKQKTDWQNTRQDIRDLITRCELELLALCCNEQDELAQDKGRHRLYTHKVKREQVNTTSENYQAGDD